MEMIKRLPPEQRKKALKDIKLTEGRPNQIDIENARNLLNRYLKKVLT